MPKNALVLDCTKQTDEGSVELSEKAFRFLVEANLLEAILVLNRLFGSGVRAKMQLGVNYIRNNRDRFPFLAYMACTSGEIATEINLSDMERETAKRFRRAKAVVTASGIVVPEYLNLEGLGPLVVPIIAVARMNLAHATDLLFPFLQTGPEQFLNIVGSRRLNFPVLERLEGEVSACRAQSPYLPALKMIGGTLDVQNSEGLTFPKLNHIGGSLTAQDSVRASFPLLQEIKETLNVRRSRSLNAPLLETARVFFSGNHEDLNLPSFRKKKGA
jgi:hypothetical protein